MLTTLPARFAILGSLTYDGRGSAPRVADVVVDAGRIAAVRPAGELNLAGTYRISGEGLSLAPGFVDAHSHSDGKIMEAPRADSKISQGVTTEVAGQCGFSPRLAPAERQVGQAAGKDAPWTDLAAYAAELDRRQPAVNVAILCGHNTLRQTVMGSEDRAPTPAELRRMREILDGALRQGAAGFSSGLWYIPGKYAETAEVRELAAALQGTRKPYVTHLRSEGDELVEATEEAIRIAANGSGRLHVSHIKTCGGANWAKFDGLMDTVAAGMRAGVRTTADRYPYLYTGTGLRMLLPAPYDRVANLHGLLRDSAAEREKLVALLEMPGWSLTPLDRTIVCNSGLPENASLLGLSLTEIGERLGVTPARACVNFLAAESYVFAAFGRMCPENLERFVGLDWVACGSDASAYPFDLSLGRAHPRAFGTFPRFFRMVRERCGAAEAIRRMTSLAAGIYGLVDRGVLAEGAHADLVLFDEERFKDRADFGNPHAMCEGVRHVFVDGKLAFDGDDPEPRGCHGRFLAL